MRRRPELPASLLYYPSADVLCSHNQPAARDNVAKPTHDLTVAELKLSKMSPAMTRFLMETESEGYFTGITTDGAPIETVQRKAKL